MVRPSFVPPPDIRQLRNLTRYWVQLHGDRTRHATWLEKLLEDASIKLLVAASNITGTSARKMLTALVDGERDPAARTDLAMTKMRRKWWPEIEAFLRLGVTNARTEGHNRALRS